VAKQDANDPGAKGADEQAKVETEAAESAQAAAEEKAEGSGQKAEGGDAAAEEKPKPKRRSRAKKPAAPAADAEKAKAEKPKAEKAKAEQAKAEDAKAEEADEETEAEAAEAAGEPEPEDEKARPAARRRRGGEAVAGRTPRRAPRRNAAPDVTVRARAKYVRCAPRKARLVIDHIRGKNVDEARAILMHTPRAASRDVLKLLNSAIANAENNHELLADELRVAKAYVDEGPTLKRYRPRALGRATRIRKRTSHLTIELAAKE
jgi:ribosomal protein L22